MASFSAEMIPSGVEVVEVQILDVEGNHVLVTHSMTAAALGKSKYLSTKLRWNSSQASEKSHPVISVTVAKEEVDWFVTVLKLMARTSNFEDELKDVKTTAILLKICCMCLYEDGIKECSDYLRNVSWQRGAEAEMVISVLEGMQMKEVNALIMQLLEIGTSPQFGRLLHCCKNPASKIVEQMKNELLSCPKIFGVNKILRMFLSCLRRIISNEGSCCYVSEAMKVTTCLLKAWMQRLEQAGGG